jgi:hypothetical protein
MIAPRHVDERLRSIDSVIPADPSRGRQLTFGGINLAALQIQRRE